MPMDVQLLLMNPNPVAYPLEDVERTSSREKDQQST